MHKIIAAGILLPGLTCGSTLADRPDPAQSVVLVVKIISTTHARLTTGVVLARADDTHPTLVVVAADFVSRGDEILVLDGGTDLLRNGLPTRTVARSADAGVAVLEVDGLKRAGIGLGSKNLRDAPEEQTPRFEFLAWPPAKDLASSASLIRQSLELAVGEDGTFVEPLPDLPAQAGAILNACGQLAGFVPGVTSETETGITPASTIASVLESAQLAYEPPGTCLEFRYSDEPGMSVEGVPAKANSDGESGDIPAVIARQKKSAGERSESSSPEQETSNMIPWLVGAAVLGLGLAAVVAWWWKPVPSLTLNLEGRHGQAPAFSTRGDSIFVRREGNEVSVKREGVDVVISNRVHQQGAPLVCVNDTPCLEGEVFVAGDGDRLSIGNTHYRIRLGQTS